MVKRTDLTERFKTKKDNLVLEICFGFQALCMSFATCVILFSEERKRKTLKKKVKSQFKKS